MSIKEAIADFKKAQDEPARFDVYVLGVLIGAATHWAMGEEDNITFYWNFYPRSPTGILPFGDIVIDWDEGVVHMFNGKEGEETVVRTDHPVNLIEAITKEL